MAVHVLQVRIIAEDGDKCVLEKRFFLMWQIHNQLVKYANRQLNKLRNDRAYIDAKRSYIPLKKSWKSWNLPTSRIKTKFPPWNRTLRNMPISCIAA